MQAMNPYSGKSFTDFFGILLNRLALFFQGKMGWQDLASDEIQIFVLVFLSFSSALIGTFLVLRRMTMLANSLSHTLLLGIVTAAFLVKQSGGNLLDINLKMLVIASLITGILTTLSTEFFQKKLQLQEDASIGLVFSAFFALGIICVTLFTRSSHLGIEAIMGNVDALHLDDLKRMFYLFLFNGGIVFLFYKRYAIMTFDSTLARNFGISVSLFNHLLMIQTAATAIGAFRAVGPFLFLAFLVAPVLTARFFTHSLKKLMSLSFLIGMVGSIVAVALSRHFLSVYQMPFSTSGLVTLTLGGFFLIGIGGYHMLRYRFQRETIINDDAEKNLNFGKHGLNRSEHP